MKKNTAEFFHAIYILSKKNLDYINGIEVKNNDINLITKYNKELNQVTDLINSFNFNDE